jgi:zinc protease
MTRLSAFASGLLIFTAAAAQAAPELVTLPSNSPLVSFRIVLRTGAAYDPAGKPGAASLTAAMLAEGGNKDLTYKQILDKLFPTAATISGSADKEMTVFGGVTHVDNLETYYGLLKSMLLEPGWREDDLKRLKDSAINYLRVSLRGNNDEELGKEVLYNEIFSGHVYGHHNAGTVSSIQKMTMEDLQKFYKQEYSQANLIIGIAGGYPAGFEKRVLKDFSALPAGKRRDAAIPDPKPIDKTRLVIVKKPTRSVAYSFGHPIDVRRGDPDFPALLLAQIYLGQHRVSIGRLYNSIREARGLNYGDYAYIEHFPNGMFRFEPEPNIARREQIFQIWIRPLEVPTAHFGLRLAMYELDQLIKNGLSEEDFRATRSYLTKYVNLLTKSKSVELGYAIDSRFYGIPDYSQYIKDALAKLTREQVNSAIRKHFRSDRIVIVAVANEAEQLRDQVVSNAPSPITYNSPKPEPLLAEDKIVAAYKLALTAEQVKILPVATVFE